jgi:hypothetical protein
MSKNNYIYLTIAVTFINSLSIWWLIRYNNDINIASQKSENDRTSWEKTMLIVTNFAMPMFNIIGIALGFYIYKFNKNKYSVGDIVYIDGRPVRYN